MKPSILSRNKDVFFSKNKVEKVAYIGVVLDAFHMHRRLDHALLQVVKKDLTNGDILFSEDKVDSTSTCNACLLSKHHKLPCTY